MSNNLYFISILTDAFRHPDPVAGLREAFDRILERRDDPAYRVGYQQWLRFLRAAAALPDTERDAITEAALRMAIARIAADAAAREPQGGESAEPDARRERCPGPIAAMPKGRPGKACRQSRSAGPSSPDQTSQPVSSVAV